MDSNHERGEGELIDADAARAWLARHPDQPDDLGPHALGPPVVAPIAPTGSAANPPAAFQADLFGEGVLP